MHDCNRASFLLFFTVRCLLCLFLLFLGNGVVTSAAKGIASENAPHTESKTDKKATFCKCLNGIGGTGRCKPATSRK